MLVLDVAPSVYREEVDECCRLSPSAFIFKLGHKTMFSLFNRDVPGCSLLSPLR
jgi:hypothetical protein